MARDQLPGPFASGVAKAADGGSDERYAPPCVSHLSATVSIVIFLAGL